MDHLARLCKNYAIVCFDPSVNMIWRQKKGHCICLYGLFTAQGLQAKVVEEILKSSPCSTYKLCALVRGFNYLMEGAHVG